MPNMSYCRFENTLGDLKDCIRALKERNILSNREKDKAKVLLTTIAEFLINEELIISEEEGCAEVNYESIEELISKCTEEDDK